jgi:hypothetical protein
MGVFRSNSFQGRFLKTVLKNFVSEENDLESAESQISDKRTKGGKKGHPDNRGQAQKPPLKSCFKFGLAIALPIF